jgi:hypothetical protein
MGFLGRQVLPNRVWYPQAASARYDLGMVTVSMELLSTVAICQDRHGAV